MPDALRRADLAGLDPQALRRVFRDGGYRGHTAGLAPGRLQCNLAIMPLAEARAFEEFCALNPVPCPLAGQSAAGDPGFPALGRDIDLRRDVPLYHVYRDGALVDRPHDISDLWRDDMVGFAIGCSFTMEAALLKAGFPMRHIERDVTVPMYRSTIETTPAGPFGGAVVVSMRPVHRDRIDEVRDLTARFPMAHGAPLHVGDPAAIGIDLDRPDWGSAVPVGRDELPVFWACGVTPQVAMMRARLPLCISHAPGAMLITDRDDGTGTGSGTGHDDDNE
ncbi:putative hydro-lyase [Limimaricola hongkongensis]|uniref:Hydro-lyase n=1 Tax=Limimaricola hongkongensis DSM 17492 TaxID=1122180 RepID=A0A017HCI9_9RHOB|nr:putative hydro-lyase [Limimaricola hongkongensis]EYD72217.1 hypothetical protein possibly connected to lactam utilization and allophanate hydrolase [Limimaricola hongkongensis DSM 17492]